MKIGILTYHRSHNFGALLQAIGLREYLESKGHEAYFVDYWPEYHRKMYKAMPSIYAPSLTKSARIKGFIQDLWMLPLRLRRMAKFKKFIERYISPHCLPESATFDCVICGSDQIWRKQPGLGGRYNPIYFGGGEINAACRMSYAGSMGEVAITKDDEDELKVLFSNFKAISVREERLASLLMKRGIAKGVSVVADPTILTGAAIWERLIGDKEPPVEGKYALYYKLMYDSFDESSIKEFAKSNGLKFIILEGNIRRDNYFDGSVTDADPLEMLRLIAHADFVFASSYHGLVFSLLFRRQLACAFKENKDRAISLLSLLGISDRLIEKGHSLPSAPIDYDKVAPRLEEIRRSSQDWLDRSLSLCSVHI